ncbi:MAG: CPBP family intramembrane metalloprotease [Leptolyngbya sp. SIOISBB]|nr:CPBP family intramembrane metalloprotease [Leptolyngbya sp. SIOISBB]
MESPLNTMMVIAGFFLSWLGVWGVIAIPLSQKFGWRPFQPTPPEQKLALLLPLYGIAPLIITVANRQLGQTWSDQGLVWTLGSALELLLGWGVAIAGLSLLLLSKRLLGLITIPKSETGSSPTPPSPNRLLTVLGLILLGLAIGGIEELVFRGWLQTQLELAFLPWVAAIAASILFALAHLIWDGRPGLWQQPGLWLLGMVLVSARWADGGAIVIAWGLHAGWVTALAYIGEFVRPLPVADKPTWLTGRVAQPLTDVLDLTLLMITAGLVWQFSGWI